MARLEITVAPREVLGKRVKRLRRAGIVPGVIYGHRYESRPIQVDARELERIVAHASAATLLAVSGLDRAPVTALLKEVQRVPTTGQVSHIDLYRVSEREAVRTEVPLHFVGTAYAVEKMDGTLLHALTHVRVECLPRDLPEAIEVDVSVLTDFDAAVHVRDLALPAGVKVLNDPDELVAKVIPPAVVEEEVVPEAAAEAAPAAAAAEEAEGEGEG